MQRRSILTIVSVTATLALAGCGGPSKAGLEARANARERLSSFNAQFTYEQAKQEFEVGQFKSAMTSATAAIEANPEVPMYHVLVGRINLETHKLEKALNAFNEAAELDPEMPDPQYYRGIVFQRLSQDDRALEAYRAAFDLEPDNVQYLLATAESHIALNDFEAARRLVEANIAKFEHNAALRHLLGQIALLEGDAVTASMIYKEVQLLDPDNTSLLEEMAWVQFDAEQFAECVSTLGEIKANRSEPRVDLLHLEARCLTILDRNAEAHRTYIELTRMDPTNASAWIEFGTLAWKVGDFRRVAQCSVRAIDTAPERFEGYMLQGLYERHQGRLDKAVELFGKAAERSLDSTMPHLLLGQALEQSGNLPAAVAAYDQALQVNPNSNEAKILKRNVQVATAEEE